MFYIKNKYKNYYYLIDNRRIASINNLLDYYLTFVSRNLSDASFDITLTSKINIYLYNIFWNTNKIFWNK